MRSARIGQERRAAAKLLGLTLWLVLGCASTFDPWPLEEIGLLDRVQTQEKQGVRVSVAVPSRNETRRLFGKDLYRDGVQPVWLEIQNHRDARVDFLPVGLDPHYYTPIEAANIDLDPGEVQTDARIDRYFFEQGMETRLSAGERQSGFVFSSLDEGTKAFNVDLVGETDQVSFTFFVPVPGLKVDHAEVDWDALRRAQEATDLPVPALIEQLEALPCCTTDKSSTDPGDPLNLIVVGDPDDVYYAFLRAGWDETETIHRGSAWKTALSFVTGGEYRYSPVSALYVFGRPQDVAFQKARDNIHERNHLRLWLTPHLLGGRSIFVGQISRDIGVRFTRRTITTHKIDPDVDETREFLLEDLAYAQVLTAMGYVGGVGAAPIEAPRANLTGDPYFTDGYRIVLVVSSTPVDIADIQTLDWRWPPDPEAP